MVTVLALGWSLLTATAATISVPVGDLTQWTAPAYRRIPANVVTVSENSIHIAVDGSASPLVYKFPASAKLSGITVRARWSGVLRIPAGAIQGSAGADDFVLKVGLVEAGDRTLNWLQRRTAADWVVTLFDLAPKGSGVKRIHFLSTTQQPDLLGSERSHPLNGLLQETRIRYLDAPGPFELSQTFAEPVDTLGLWISADGDDTDSRFDLWIDEIILYAD